MCTSTSLPFWQGNSCGKETKIFLGFSSLVDIEKHANNHSFWAQLKVIGFNNPTCTSFKGAPRPSHAWKTSHFIGGYQHLCRSVQWEMQLSHHAGCYGRWELGEGGVLVDWVEFFRTDSERDIRMESWLLQLHAKSWSNLFSYLKLMWSFYRVYTGTET